MLQYGQEMNETCVLQNFAWTIYSEDEQWLFCSHLNRQARQRETAALEGKLTREHKQSALTQWHCFSWRLVQGNQDVNCNHMFSRNIEGTVFLGRRISLCVYYCFDVCHKFLHKGHKIVMTHHKPSCYNTLTV